MITIFFNENGYYITGDSVEASRRCSPALTIRGDKIFQSLHHTYKILYLALNELRDIHIDDDVMVYNDSRIIDEINGSINPLDEICERWLQTLRRDIIPDIRSLIFFRKKPTTYINSTIEHAHQSMLSHIDEKTRQKLTAQENLLHTKIEKARKQKLIQRLKQSWFGDKNG